MKDQLLHVCRNAELGVLWTKLGIDQGFFALSLVFPFPPVEDFLGDAKMPTGLGNIPDLLCVFQDPQLTPDVRKGFCVHLKRVLLTSQNLSTKVQISIKTIKQNFGEKNALLSYIT
jgi:hypothetical protein